MKNAIPAMIAMLMVLIYNLADTLFIGMTYDAWRVAAVSLATPLFLLFMSVGNMLNVIFNPLFILAFKWNIAGAAIATVIGNLVAAVF